MKSVMNLPLTIAQHSRGGVVLQSEVQCPNCGHKKMETMPTEACQYFYECENCKQVLKPKVGDCCVYCSYGKVKCPSKQADGSTVWRQ